jgi:hypothetical protein
MAMVWVDGPGACLDGYGKPLQWGGYEPILCFRKCLHRNGKTATCWHSPWLGSAMPKDIAPQFSTSQEKEFPSEQSPRAWFWISNLSFEGGISVPSSSWASIPPVDPVSVEARLSRSLPHRLFQHRAYGGKALQALYINSRTSPYTRWYTGDDIHLFVASWSRKRVYLHSGSKMDFWANSSYIFNDHWLLSKLHTQALCSFRLHLEWAGIIDAGLCEINQG